MINNINNILVLAPHTDDGELGMGGTIHKLIQAGKHVTYAAFSTAEQSVPEGFPKDILKTEVRNATNRLGIKPENLMIFNYEVRKLNYVRQEILEKLIYIRKQRHYDKPQGYASCSSHRCHYGSQGNSNSHQGPSAGARNTLSQLHACTANCAERKH